MPIFANDCHERRGCLAILLAAGVCMGAGCQSSGVAGGGSSVNAGPDRTVNVGATVTLMGTSTGGASHKG